ncbi:MAG: redox-sensing transcriptional repressor Rex [Candidatus Xenobia bacterium]
MLRQGSKPAGRNARKTAATRIPEPTIQRLPLYYRALQELSGGQQRTVSSEDMAALTGVKASQFRKDLSCFGEFGVQGVGYSVQHLLERIAEIMRINQMQDAVLVGAGNLGSALVNHKGFPSWGFQIVAVFDNSPSRVGQRVGPLTVRDMSELPQPLGVPIGIIAVPAEGAVKVGQLLARSGIRGILNFSGTKLPHTPGVVVRNVDLTDQLAILSYYLRPHDGRVPGG